MVTGALVPDLYCPGYSSAETLSKEANLMRTAVRYNVEASKITAIVTAALSAKKRTTKGKSLVGSSRRAPEGQSPIGRGSFFRATCLCIFVTHFPARGPEYVGVRRGRSSIREGGGDKVTGAQRSVKADGQE